MVYNSQRGRGFNDIFGTLNRTFKPVIEGAADVGANLATGLVGELLSGKSPKASIKATGDRAKTMVAQRALQGLQGGSGTKRKRKKRKQSGGRIFPPPVHYPGGNYPGYDMIGVVLSRPSTTGSDVTQVCPRCRDVTSGRGRSRRNNGGGVRKGGGELTLMDLNFYR